MLEVARTRIYFFTMQTPVMLLADTLPLHPQFLTPSLPSALTPLPLSSRIEWIGSHN